jgi:hypothetical protein
MEMEWKRDYGPELKRLRHEKKKLQRDIAVAIRKSDDAVARYERDDERAQIPPRDVWEPLAKALDFPSAEAFFAELEARRGAHPLDSSRLPPLGTMPVDEVLEALNAVLAENEPWPGAARSSTHRSVKPLSVGTLWASIGTGSVLASFLPRALPDLLAGYEGANLPLKRVVVLHLSKTTCDALERVGLLDLGFHELIQGHLTLIRETLARHGVKFDAFEAGGVPPWHGFLWGDHLFRGSWQIGRSRLLDVHTPLEHVLLRRSPRVHVEFLTAFFALFREPAALGLRLGEYAIFGSGPLAIRGLRDAADVDVIVTRQAWDRLVAEGHPVEAHDSDLKIQVGKVEILRTWHPEVAPIERLIEEAEIILGLPFVRLDRVEAWKRAYGRPKDGPDLERIDAYQARCGSVRTSLPVSQQSGWSLDMGRALREERNRRGLSLAELAGGAGIDENTLKKNEEGSAPRRETLNFIAEALGHVNGAALAACLQKSIPNAGLPIGVKVGHVLRAISATVHRGFPLVVLAGVGEVTRMIVSRAYESEADRRVPVVSGVLFFRFPDEMLWKLQSEGKLGPTFGDALRANVAGIRATLDRVGVPFEERFYADFPRWHGYLVATHAFLGRWRMDGEQRWNAESRVQHLVRGSAEDPAPELWDLNIER